MQESKAVRVGGQSLCQPLHPVSQAIKDLARFMFEAGMLKKMRRTGYP